MDMTERKIGTWLELGSKFFKTAARNSVVRAALAERGLTDEELTHGWALFSDLHGFASPEAARRVTSETVAAKALNEIDAWDAPAFAAAHAVLDGRLPEVSAFLFDNLEASTGAAAIAGVERFLDRLEALRKGTASQVSADQGKQAIDLLAMRKIIDAPREAQLRDLIGKVRKGARPEEVIPAPEMDPARREVATTFIAWLHEWREVARIAVSRHDYHVALGLASPRKSRPDTHDEEPEAAPTTPAKPAVH